MNGSPRSAVDSPQLNLPPQPNSNPFRALNAGSAAGFLLLATVVLFWNFLDPRTGLVLSKLSEDMTQDFIGWRQFAFEELKKGHLALWNPQMLCGAPFFGDFQSALLYPPNWLFMAFPMPFAINTCIALHVFGMGWFTYLWIVQRGSRPESALLGALMTMLGGAYFLHIVPGHLPNLCSMVWIPLIFMAMDGYREKRTAGWILLGSSALALQILSGHVQYAYDTVMVGGFYVILTLSKVERKASFIGGLTMMGLGAALLTAVQLGAGWDAAWDSLRGQKLPIDIVDIADMTPERLWCLLAPDFFGSWDHYWGGGFYWEGATFVSLTGFILAVFSFPLSDHPQKKILGWLALFLTVLAVGKRTPVFILFYKYFPLFGNFRGVSKFNIFITLFLSVLAALALDQILKNPKSARGLVKPLAWGSGAVLILVLSFAAAPYLGAEKFRHKFADHAGSMEGSLLICGIMLGLLSMLSYFTPKVPFLRFGFIFLAGLELFCFAKNNLPFFSYQAYTEKVGQMEKVYRQAPGDYRILMGNSYALSTSGSDIWGEDPVIPSRFAAFVALTQHCDPNDAFLQRFTFREFPQALGLLRLRYHFTEESGTLRVERLHLKEAPRAFLADRWEVLPKAEALRKASSPGFDWSEEVLLETDPGMEMTKGKSKNQVLITDRSTDLIEVQATLSKPAILVMTDNYSRDWKARPFSTESTGEYSLGPANGFQRAVPLKAGNHHFVMEYQPQAFRAGKWITLVSLWFFLLLARREYARHRRAS